jgi:hypothetical protein
MQRLVIGLALAFVLTVQVLPAWAGCTTHTYMLEGRTVICTTCGYLGGNCTTTCF